jgi:polyhydroxyalkanoate synthesis regulator phasin
VQQYFPHLVYEIPEFGGLGIDYISFIPVLWAINQEQQFQIDRQRGRIQHLERQIRFINDFNADELRRQQNRIDELERKLNSFIEKLSE